MSRSSGYLRERLNKSTGTRFIAASPDRKPDLGVFVTEWAEMRKPLNFASGLASGQGNAGWR